MCRRGPCGQLYEFIYAINGTKKCVEGLFIVFYRIMKDFQDLYDTKLVLM